MWKLPYLQRSLKLVLVTSSHKSSAWQVLHCLGLIPSGESCYTGIKTCCSELRSVKKLRGGRQSAWRVGGLGLSPALSEGLVGTCSFLREMTSPPIQLSVTWVFNMARARTVKWCLASICALSGCCFTSPAVCGCMASCWWAFHFAGAWSSVQAECRGRNCKSWCSLLCPNLSIFFPSLGCSMDSRA